MYEFIAVMRIYMGFMLKRTIQITNRKEMRDLERASVAFSKVCALLFACCLFVSQVDAVPLSLADNDISLEGPNNLWVEVYNYTSVLEHIDISRTESGYIISGLYHNYSSLDPYQGIIIEVSSNGSVLFQEYLGGVNYDEIYSITQCHNGDFVIVGNTESFGANETGDSFPKLWLVRLSNNGSILWNKWYDDIYWGYSLAECQDGSFIIATGTPHLVRVDENGSLLWSKSYQDWDFSEANSVVECEDGGFAFAGWADTDPTSEIGSHAWLVRTDSDGTMLWNQTYGEADLNIGSSLIRCSDGGFAIAGESGSHIYLPAFSWLIRTDETGNLLWERTYSRGRAHSVVQCSDGGFGIAGFAVESGSYRAWHALFVRTDEEGYELWRSTCSGPDDDFASSLVLSDDGFAVVGTTLQAYSSKAFLWLLTDDYVPPTGGIPLPVVIVLVSLSTGILIAAVIIWKQKKKIGHLEGLGPIVQVTTI
ncbi:MAG: hypothetical protein ACXAC0_08045 [Candidatus Thorarchaeota archaeon]|jgi:hypothetical protein